MTTAQSETKMEVDWVLMFFKFDRDGSRLNGTTISTALTDLLGA